MRVNGVIRFLLTKPFQILSPKQLAANMLKFSFPWTFFVVVDESVHGPSQTPSQSEARCSTMQPAGVFPKYVRECVSVAADVQVLP